MRSLAVGLVLLGTVGLAGCASTHPVDDYTDLPGSGDHMSEGPGLFAGSQADSYDGGFTVYSDDPDQEALINPNRSDDDDAAPAAASNSQPSDFEEFREYQQYQEYQRFRNMPKDSEEYREFQQWQRWQNYQEWKAQQQQRSQ